MNFKKLFQTGIVLIALLVLFSSTAVALDKVTLTWQADANSSKSVTIQATSGETFIVDWGIDTNGDGIINVNDYFTYTGGGGNTLSFTYFIAGTYTVRITASNPNCRFTYFSCSNNQINSLILTDCSALTSLSCYNNQLTSLDVSDCTALGYFGCRYNQLTSLDVSKCPNLTYLSCSYNQINNLNVTDCSLLSSLICTSNQLTKLDLTGCSALWYLACESNRFQLSDIYVFSELLKNKYEIVDGYLSYAVRLFNPQVLISQTTSIGQTLFEIQNVFNASYTNYEVLKDGLPASTSDYSINSGTLVFNAVGVYAVTMTNDSILSNTIIDGLIDSKVNYPTESMVNIYVTEIPEISITPSDDNTVFTWQAQTNATSYKLAIYSDIAHSQIVCVLEFDANGNYISTQQTPLLNLSSSTSTADFSYKVLNLTANTTYYYLMTAYQDAIAINQQQGSFTTANQTAISTVTIYNTPKIVGYYNVLGQKLPQEPQHGIYIIQYDNGKTKKVLKK
jgi:hypothetical protein